MSVHWAWRRQPRQPALTVRIEGMEQLVAVIADLASATADLTAAVTSAVDVLTTPPGDVTHLSPADQAAFDASVAAVQQATSNLNAALPPAPTPGV